MAHGSCASSWKENTRPVELGQAYLLLVYMQASALLSTGVLNDAIHIDRERCCYPHLATAIS